jgi:hypothetical protein
MERDKNLKIALAALLTASSVLPVIVPLSPTPVISAQQDNDPLPAGTYKIEPILPDSKANLAKEEGTLTKKQLAERGIYIRDLPQGIELHVNKNFLNFFSFIWLDDINKAEKNENSNMRHGIEIDIVNTRGLSALDISKEIYRIIEKDINEVIAFHEQGKITRQQRDHLLSRIGDEGPYKDIPFKTEFDKNNPISVTMATPTLSESLFYQYQKAFSIESERGFLLERYTVMTDPETGKIVFGENNQPVVLHLYTIISPSISPSFGSSNPDKIILYQLGNATTNIIAQVLGDEYRDRYMQPGYLDKLWKKAPAYVSQHYFDIVPTHNMGWNDLHPVTKLALFVFATSIATGLLNATIKAATKQTTAEDLK